MMTGGNTDTTAPTVTMIEGSIGTGDNANTITWTVTFSEPVRNLANTQFTVSGGGTVAMLSATSGTSVTVVSTHTNMNDGDIVLTFTPSTVAADNDGNNFDENGMNLMSSVVAITVEPEVNFIVDLPTTARSAISSVTATRNVARSMDSGMVTLGGTAYTFTSPTSRDGMIVSTNNEIAILKTGDSTAGVTTLITGTNVDGNGNGATDITNIDMIAHGTITSMAQSPTSGTVTYTGDYIVARVPADMDSIENTIAIGEINLTADFANNTLTDSATDESNAASGTFTSGVINARSSGTNFAALTFNGSGTLSYATALRFSGNFVGDNAANLSGVGKNAADASGNSIVMGIVGSR